MTKSCTRCTLRGMSRRAAVTVTAVFAAAVGGVLWYRGGVVLAAVGSLVTVGLFLAGIVSWVRKRLPKSEPLPRRYAKALLGGGTVTVLVAALLPASAFDRGSPSDPPPSRAPSAGGALSTTAPPSPTPDPALARYCELALEFLAHAQRFSGKGWQGTLTKRDFDPIVRTANAALQTAPQEMRAPMTVLASSYEAARDGWSDDRKFENVGLAIGTILSPSASAAADTVDTYENEHCF